MSFLKKRDSLTAWYKADSLLEGDQLTAGVIGQWPDFSGNGYHLLPAGSPVVVTETDGEGNALPFPVVNFDGTDDVFNGTTLSNILGASAGTVLALVKVDSIGTDSATINQNDAVWNGSTSTTPGSFLKSTGTRVYCFDNDGAAKSQFTTGYVGAWYVVVWRHLSGQLYVAADDVYSATKVAAGAGTGYAGTLQVGCNYQDTLFADMKAAEIMFFNAGLDDDTIAQYVAYLQAKWLTRGDVYEQGRDVASRRIFMLSRPLLLVAVECPLKHADLDLGDDVILRHRLGLAVDGLDTAGAPVGWHTDYSRSAHLEIVESTVDFDTLEVKLLGMDRRRTMGYIESLVPLIEGNSGGRQGCANLAPTFRVHHRNSFQYVVDVSGYVVKVPWGDDAESTDGLLLTAAVNNQLLRSSYVSGIVTGYTDTPGTGGTITDDAVAPLLFDSTVTTHAKRLTSGTTDCITQWPATGSNSGLRTVLLYYYNRTSDALTFRVFNGSNYLDIADATFKAGPIDNSLPLQTGGIGKYSFTFDGGSPSVLTLSVAFRGVTSGRIATIYHGGINNDISTEIDVTDAAVVGVKPALLSLGVAAAPDATSRRGTLCLLVKATGASAAELAGSLTCIFDWSSAAQQLHGLFDKTNGWGFSAYDATNGRVTAWLAGSHVADTWYRLAFRFTDNDLGLANRHTLSIFVDGVKGADVSVPTAQFLSTIPTTLNFFKVLATGLTISRNVFGCYLKGWEVFRVALRDEEIARWGT
jgi:hypothetical protein